MKSGLCLLIFKSGTLIITGLGSKAGGLKNSFRLFSPFSLHVVPQLFWKV